MHKKMVNKLTQTYYESQQFNLLQYNQQEICSTLINMPLQKNKLFLFYVVEVNCKQ